MTSREANLPWAKKMAERKKKKKENGKKKKKHLANHKFQRPSHICVLSAFSG